MQHTDLWFDRYCMQTLLVFRFKDELNVWVLLLPVPHPQSDFCLSGSKVSCLSLTTWEAKLIEVLFFPKRVSSSLSSSGYKPTKIAWWACLSRELLRFVLVLQLDPLLAAVSLPRNLCGGTFKGDPALPGWRTCRILYWWEHCYSLEVFAFAPGLELILWHRSGSGYYVCNHITVDLFGPRL